MKLFTQHPKSVHETYFQHLVQASCFGVRMITGGVICIIHGLLPFLFEKTASGMIIKLNKCMVENRIRLKKQQDKES